MLKSASRPRVQEQIQALPVSHLPEGSAGYLSGKNTANIFLSNLYPSPLHFYAVDAALSMLSDAL